MTEPTLIHPLPATEATPATRRVLVRDLVVPARIGVYKHERDGQQRVRINLDLGVREGGPIRDSLDNVLCYEQIVLDSRRIAGAGHINLVETLAERLATMCLGDWRVIGVRVRVEKIDVFDDLDSIGIEIERFNENALAAEIQWFRRSP